MAMLPTSVLVAVDFGDASARAVALGGAVAEASRVSLRLLHAESIEAPPYFTTEQIEVLTRQRQASRAQAEQYLLRFGRNHTKQPVTVVVEDRPPVDAILHAAQSADLVVMGTHGRQGPKRWWLGSVAERVLREIATPLLIVRAAEKASGNASSGRVSEEGPPFARVLVHAAPALEGSRALDYAQGLARAFGGEVFDARGEALEPALDRARATVLVAAAPTPRTSSWLSQHGESLVRHCQLPILFVPEVTEGASS